MSDIFLLFILSMATDKCEVIAVFVYQPQRHVIVARSTQVSLLCNICTAETSLSLLSSNLCDEDKCTTRLGLGICERTLTSMHAHCFIVHSGLPRTVCAAATL